MEIKIIKHFLVFLFILLPVQIAGILLLPFILPFVPRDAMHLPERWVWFDNLNDGINGDIYYRRANDLTQNSSEVKYFWVRYKWLAWRNPCNVFQYIRLGKLLSRRSILVEEIGSNNVNDTPGGQGGLHYMLVDNETEELFEYYRIVPYTVLGKRLCIRARIGWKLNGFVGEDIRVQWVFSVNPFKKYLGD